jgi:hypothetical protein
VSEIDDHSTTDDHSKKHAPVSLKELDTFGDELQPPKILYAFSS